MLNAQEHITELPIYNKDTGLTIFSDKSIKYVIPLYQRAFAWGDKEIIQLIEDISDFDNSNGALYYLGSIIVAKEGNRYEVIDGQQRLTALFLLLNYLHLPMESILTFECRKKSDYTLQKIVSGKEVSVDDIDQGLLNGKKIIENQFGHFTDFYRNHFIEKLTQVRVYRIEVPEHTDLNHYFEIMNTRGEQLEQQDILKATLMSGLSPANQARFSKIWDACSDMTGYVQMHFDTETRKTVFGYDWTEFPTSRFSIPAKVREAKRILDIIKPGFVPNQSEEIADSEDRVRFESIISFPHFLLHVLRVYVDAEKIDVTLFELLDDKKLTEAFNYVLIHGTIAGKNLDKSKFAMGFAGCLLKCRYLFDKYIIKREFVNDDSDGEWSLKSLKSSGQQSKKKPYYVNTYFGLPGEWSTTYEPRHKRIFMLQSCLRVSYTSPKVMHWITSLLTWLYKNRTLDTLTGFEQHIEKFIKGEVVENYFTDCNFDLGANTPHIVFNYLDYLLWKMEFDRSRDKTRYRYSDFIFEFRNSVEHWYPQHPSGDTFEVWGQNEGVNHFGNLCIIQRTVNSKFSNMSPESKQSTFEKMISKGSIKLRIMSELVQKDIQSGRNPNLTWKKTTYLNHGIKMLNILAEACGVVDCIRPLE